MVASALRGVVAQRLVRRICPHCKTAYAANAEEKAYLNINSSDGLTLYKGSGCEKCRGTGYLGRMALQEVMPVVPELKNLFGQGAGRNAFCGSRKIWCGKYAQRWSAKVLKGHTSLAEVLQAVH